MAAVRDNPDLRENLADLRKGPLKLIALLASSTVYVWLFLNIWAINPHTTGDMHLPPVSAWVGIGLLAGSAMVGYFLTQCNPNAVAHILSWGILGATTCAVLSYDAPGSIFLFVLPIAVASVLLDEPYFLLLSAVAMALTLIVVVMEAGPGSEPAAFVLPGVVVALITGTLWLSSRNLQIALEWVWSGYERARTNELQVRERQAELKQALKALDQATHRLERTNYMLAIARDQAEEARRLKQQFAQNISHELRTPLSMIVGFSELMAQSPEYYGSQLPRSYMRDLSIVYRNARHLQDLVNDVLDLARIETAQMNLTVERVNPAALVEEAVDTVRSLVEVRGLALRTRFEPDLPYLWADRTRVRQVLLNLFSNAVRFTEEGGITVSVTRNGQEVIFAVADTGVGITPEDIPHVFDEFWQADGRTGQSREGAGLGLAISQHFVHLHRGRIWVESQQGKGSTFFFTLPVEGQHGAAPASVRSVAKQSTSFGRGSEEPVLLVVTPSHPAAALLTRCADGCRTAVVPDVESAREAALRLKPQVVVLDQACDGVEQASPEDIAAMWELPGVPFVKCPLPEKSLLGTRHAVEGYLLKPLSHRNLLDVLRQFGEDVDTVLVVDDDRDFVRMLSRFLDNPVRRYRVISAYTGQEGLDMMRQHRPDLVLLDLMLPDLSGYQVFEQIRSDPDYQAIPIVIVSAQDEIDYQQRLMGGITISQAGGMTPGEVVGWVQRAVETAVTAQPVPQG